MRSEGKGGDRKSEDGYRKKVNGPKPPAGAGGEATYRFADHITTGDR